MPNSGHDDLGRIGNALMQDVSDREEIWHIAVANNNERWDANSAELLNGRRVQGTERLAIDPGPARVVPNDLLETRRHARVLERRSKQRVPQPALACRFNA